MKYVLTRLNGDGTETRLHPSVPLSGAAITVALSGPGGLAGSITPEIAALKDSDGRPLIVPWQTALYADDEGTIRGGGIITDPQESTASLQLDALGHSGYLTGIPYLGEQPAQIQVDPLDMARHIWAHAQAQPAGNIGMVLDATKSPVKVGTVAKDVDFTTAAGEAVSFQAGPYQLTEWNTEDLGKAFDDLAAGTPFEYRTEHYWDGDTIRHRLRLGYPRLGRRRHDLHFVTGENITAAPGIDHLGDDYANAVLVLGAGEGRAMVRYYAASPDGRLRRPVVVTDKTITSKKAAASRAARELKLRQGVPDISGDIVIRQHKHAPIGSFDPGDEILIQTGKGWTGRLAVWARILSTTYAPEAGTVTLSVIQTEKLE